jgi:hypothetical protein
LRFPGLPLQGHAPVKRGPCYQVSRPHKDKSGTKFVKTEALQAVRKQLKNYECMKLFVEKWIDLAMELSMLRLTKKPTE